MCLCVERATCNMPHNKHQPVPADFVFAYVSLRQAAAAACRRCLVSWGNFSWRLEMRNMQNVDDNRKSPNKKRATKVLVDFFPTCTGPLRLLWTVKYVCCGLFLIFCKRIMPNKCIERSGVKEKMCGSCISAKTKLDNYFGMRKNRE